MSPDRFDHLLSLIEPIVTKESTNLREPISAGERLSITLRFLATGDAIYEVLSPMYMRSPNTQADWLAIAKDFEEIWNLPHVIGSINGKHIRMMCPANTGTLCHNYKG